MNADALIRQFARIGATLEVTESPVVRGRNAASNFSLDIKEEGRNEFYLLEIAKPAIETVEFQVLNNRPDLRHLVLMSRDHSLAQPAKSKFLCGHDERHWFVAGLPDSGVTDVRTAMESLKPQMAVVAQRRMNVRPKDRNKRHNDGFIRQGEWFFIPVAGVNVGPLSIILKDEPLSRGAGSKPHIVSELVRHAGAQVWTHRNGTVLTEDQFQWRVRNRRIKQPSEWTVQRANAAVFVRGKVRHADHKTIVLKGWHRVFMNAEPMSNNVAFLD